MRADIASCSFRDSGTVLREGTGREWEGGSKEVMREHFLSIHPHSPPLPSRQAALGRGCDKIAAVWVGCGWVSWWNTS